MKLKFYVINHFFRVCEVIGNGQRARYTRYIGETLSQIAPTVDRCGKLLRFIEEVESGVEKSIITGGNDITLTIYHDYIQVDYNVVDEWADQPEGRFTLDEWKKALEGWKQFLKIPIAKNSVIEVDLDNSLDNSGDTPLNY